MAGLMWIRTLQFSLFAGVLAVVPARVNAEGNPSLRMTVEIVETGTLPVEQIVEIQEVPEPSAFLLLVPAGLWLLRRCR